MAAFSATTSGSCLPTITVVGEQSRRCRVRSSRGTPLLTARDFRLPAGRNWAGTPANSHYLLSTASCRFAYLSAAFTAARNESLLAGACTSPDSVLRKETFLP